MPAPQATPDEYPGREQADRARRIHDQLSAEVAPVVEGYARSLARSGHGLDAVGGAESVAAAVRAVLPRPNRLAERVGPVYLTGSLQRLLPGVDAAPITDQAVRNRVEAGRLIAFKTADGRLAYPVFQFDAQPGRLVPRDDVLELWRVLLPGGPIDDVTLVAWLTGPRRDLDGRTPLAWLDDHGLDERLERAAGRLRRRASAA